MHVRRTLLAQASRIAFTPTKGVTNVTLIPVSLMGSESEMTSFRLKRLISILDVHWATIIAAEDSDSDITWLLIDEIITMSPEIQESFLRMALAINTSQPEPATDND